MRYTGAYHSWYNKLGRLKSGEKQADSAQTAFPRGAWE